MQEKKSKRAKTLEDEEGEDEEDETGMNYVERLKFYMNDLYHVKKEQQKKVQKDDYVAYQKIEDEANQQMVDDNKDY